MKLIFIFLAFGSLVLSENCLSRDYGNGGTVCVCNLKNCTRQEAVASIGENEYVIYTSNKAGLRFSLDRGAIGNSPEANGNVIEIDQNVTYQEIKGFGGAFTDSTGINILSLKKSLQNEILKAYFSPDEGIGYNLCRVPIGGTDFSTHPYSYHNEEDPTLSNFTLAREDYIYKIPLIKKAAKLAGNLDLFASAWIAPLWMKTNGKYDGPYSFLKPNYYQTWANYFILFLRAYSKEGIEYWGITSGNEPITGLFGYAIPSVAWTTETLGNWIAEHLGPTLRNSRFSNITLMAFDDKRFDYPLNAMKMFLNEKVKEYVDGFAVHWYSDKYYSASLLTDTHSYIPDKFILATEACEGSTAGQEHVLLGAWERAETYAENIIEDLNNWVTGWVDWNMALNAEGGPTYISNFVDSPIIVNSTANEFYKQPMYYAMGHFSKFLPRGSVIIKTTAFSSNVPIVAAKRPDNSTVVVILNKESSALNVTLQDSDNKTVTLYISAYSTTTVMY